MGSLFGPRFGQSMLVVALLVGVGCQSTPSGQAINARLGSALSRLWTAPIRLFEDEVRRGRNLATTSMFSGWVHPTEFATVTGHGGQALSREFDAIQHWPAKVIQSLSREFSAADRDLQALLGDETRGVRDRQRMGLWMSELRGNIRVIPDMLGLVRPILAGPGDLDRTDDPFQMGRGWTWVERLLMRF